MISADPLLSRLGSAVRALRTERGWTIRELAAASEVSVRFVSDVEGGKGNVSVLTLARLARALGVPPASLLDESAAASPVGVPSGRRRVLALVGLRGAGKSTIGHRLAEKSGRRFVELDARVEQAAGLSLAEIFALHGDAFYRRLETTVLERFLDQDSDAVLATGGGIVTNPEAWSILKRRATVVWLKARPDDHWTRVVRQGDRRPMRANPRARTELKALLRAREPLYRQADHVVDTSHLGVEGAVAALARL